MKRIFLILSLFTPLLTGAASERPNILFLIADDASRDSFGAYGAKYVKTPHFDRLAKEGVLFTQAYNCNPKCAPARACLLMTRRRRWVPRATYGRWAVVGRSKRRWRLAQRVYAEKR